MRISVRINGVEIVNTEAGVGLREAEHARVLASLFCELDDDRQAQVFEHVAAGFKAFDRGADYGGDWQREGELVIERGLDVGGDERRHRR